DNFSNPQAALSRQPVMINVLFLRTPTLEADAVAAEIANSSVIVDQQSEILRNLLNEYPDVNFVGAPRVTGLSGNQMPMSVTRPVQVDGADSEGGIILHVTH